MTKQDNNTNQNSKEDVVIGSVKRDPLKLFRKNDTVIINGKDINNNSGKSVKDNVNNIKDGKPKKAFKIIYIAVVVALIVSVILNVILAFNNKKETQPLNDFIATTQNKSLYGESELAVQEIKNRKDLNNTLDQQILISAAYFNGGDFQKSLDTLLYAENNFEATSELMKLIALSYESLNNSEKALEYRAKQLELVKIEPNYPTKDKDIETLQKMLNKEGA